MFRPIHACAKSSGQCGGCAKIAGSIRKEAVPLHVDGGHFVRALRELCVTDASTERKQDAINTASRYAAYHWNGTHCHDTLHAIAGTKVVQVSVPLKKAPYDFFSQKWKLAYCHSQYCAVMTCVINVSDSLSAFVICITSAFNSFSWGLCTFVGQLGTHTHMHTDRFSGHFKDKPVLAGSPIELRSSMISILSILTGQFKAVHILFDTIPWSLPWMFSLCQVQLVSVFI